MLRDALAVLAAAAALGCGARTSLSTAERSPAGSSSTRPATSTSSAGGGAGGAGGQTGSGGVSGSGGGEACPGLLAVSPKATKTIPLQPGFQDFPVSLATMSLGASDAGFSAVWGFYGFPDSVLVQHFDAAGAPKAASQMLPTSYKLLAFASNASGQGALTSTAFATDGAQLGYRRIDPAGAASAPHPVPSGFINADYDGTAAAVAADGSLWLAWVEFGGSNVVIRHIDASDKTIGDYLVPDDNHVAFSDGPAIAVDALGRVVVAWLHWNAIGDGDLRVRWLDTSGQPLGPAQIIATLDMVENGYGGTPSLAADGQGNAVIVWGRIPTPTLYAQRLGVDGPHGPVILVDTAVNSDFPQFGPNFGAPYRAVAADRHGNFVVAWPGNTSLLVQHAHFRRYDASGDPIEPAQTIPEALTEGVTAVGVAAWPCSGFVLGWTWAVNKTLKSGAYAALYATP